MHKTCAVDLKPITGKECGADTSVILPCIQSSRLGSDIEAALNKAQLPGDYLYLSSARIGPQELIQLLNVVDGFEFLDG